jgi:hypothetical protein
MDALYLLAPLKLVRGKLLLHDGAGPLERQETVIIFYLEVIQQVKARGEIISHGHVFFEKFAQ